MKLYAPRYYKEFKCIADRCIHSCCIGWEIDIDENTQKKYATLSGGYGEAIKSSIAGEVVPHFELCENDRCPHLDGQGLCKIITELGEGYLCDICREHPRFYNETAHGKEVGLGLSCEEACRIILSSDGYAEFDELCEVTGEIKPCDFDAVMHRNQIYRTLAEPIPYEERLGKIAESYAVSLSVHTDTEWREIFGELEYLDDANRALFSYFQSNPQSAKDIEKLLERAFAYFVFRHCSEAKSEGEFTTSLGFAMLLERLLASLSTPENIHDMARIISEEIEYSEDNTESLKFEFI